MKAGIVAACVLAPFAASGQTSPPAGGELRFEVASVKAAADPKGPTLSKGGPGYPTPEQWTGTNWDLELLVTRAWHVWHTQVSGPSSMEQARYDITAKVPSGTTPDEFNQMLRTLLLERIGLVVHHEFREQPVYEMTIAKGGLKMKPAELPPPGAVAPAEVRSMKDKDGKWNFPPGFRAGMSGNSTDGGVRMVGRMMSFVDILKWWEGFAQRPIVDKTGLSGNFDFAIEFGSENSPVPPSAAAGSNEAPMRDDASLPKLTFLEALEKQLGLRVAPAKAPVDVLVVDRFNRTPSEN